MVPPLLEIILQYEIGQCIVDGNWHRLRSTCKAMRDSAIARCSDPIRIFVKTAPTTPALERQLARRKIAVYMNYRPIESGFPATTVDLNDAKFLTGPHLIVTELHFAQSISTRQTDPSFNVNVVRLITRLLNTKNLERLVLYEAFQEEQIRWGKELDLLLNAISTSNLKSITLAQRSQDKTVLRIVARSIIHYLPPTVERLSLCNVSRAIWGVRELCKPSTVYLESTVSEGDTNLRILSEVKHLHMNAQNFWGPGPARGMLEQSSKSQPIKKLLDQAPMLETLHYSYHDADDDPTDAIRDALFARPNVRVFLTQTTLQTVGLWLDPENPMNYLQLS